MLVIDDLNGLSGKRGAQQELHHLIDQLVDRNAFVIVTTQTLPAAMPGLSEMLRTRLVGGLNVPVQLPAAATRQVLLERYAEVRGISLPKKSIQSLVEGLNVPAPALLGALMELELAAITDGKTLDAESVRRYLTAKVREKSVSMREIAAATARYFNLRLADLKSPSRRKAIVSARNLAVFLARGLTSQSLEQIGEYFGGRDHTTILHGYRKIAELAKSDPATKQTLTELKRMIAIA
jgi:chromosomal replication initiator protein